MFSRSSTDSPLLLYVFPSHFSTCCHAGHLRDDEGAAAARAARNAAGWHGGGAAREKAQAARAVAGLPDAVVRGLHGVLPLRVAPKSAAGQRPIVVEAAALRKKRGAGLGDWDGSDGGTANCVRYAEKVGRPLLRINPKHLGVAYAG